MKDKVKWWAIVAAMTLWFVFPIVLGLHIYRERHRTDTPTGQHNIWLHVDASCVATSTTDANGIEQLSYIQCGGHKK